MVSPRLASAFEQRYELLVTFTQREGHACVPVSHQEVGFNLGRWVAAQRSNYHSGKLNTEQIKALEGLDGWAWRASDFQWGEGIAALNSFYKREKHVLVPSNHVEERFALGEWVSKQRKRLKHGRLTKAQVKALTRHGEMNENWRDKRNRKRWNERFAILERYAKEHGSSAVPRHYTESGIALGVWVNSLRSQHSNGVLEQDLIERLEALPDWRWAKPRRIVFDK